MAATPAVCDFDWPAPNFELPGTDRRSWSFDEIKGERGTLIMFICNHCPYVIAVIDRIVRDARDLQAKGIGVAAICSNDATMYPADSFENMQKMAEDQGFTFPYLHDEDQSVARAFDAACTPDFFGFNAAMGLQYRGRLDASRAQPAPLDARRDLFEAMAQISQTGQGPKEQVPSMGCSIKWK